jgi:hypothetical protein
MTFILIHSPLIGPSSWQPVAAALRDQGHHAIVRDLRVPPPTVEAFWSWQVAAVTAAVDAPDAVTLVAHSGSGPLLPAIGAAIAGRVERYVFVDAALPHPGRSRLEALPASFADRLRRLEVDGWLPPWHDGRTGPERLLPDRPQRAYRRRDRTASFRMFGTFPRSSVARRPMLYVRLSAAYDDGRAAAHRLKVVILTSPLVDMTDPADGGCSHQFGARTASRTASPLAGPQPPAAT